MGRSKASKRLKRLEREVDKCRVQRTHYDKLIDELESRKQQLLFKLDPNNLQSKNSELHNTIAKNLPSNPANSELAEACRRVKNALEQVKATVEEIRQATKHARTDDCEIAEITPDTNEETYNNSDSAGEAVSNKGRGNVDLLEQLNSPKMQQVAKDLISELLKDA